MERWRRSVLRRCGLPGGLELPFAPRSGSPFALAFAWFWLLDRAESGTGAWWTILLVGLLIGVV